MAHFVPRFDALNAGHQLGQASICIKVVQRVMPGLVPGIHVFLIAYCEASKT